MSQMKDPNKKIVSDSKTKRISVKTVNKDPSLTKQQFKDECDINKIMSKYQTTGEFTHITSKQGIYADFSDITDYREMLHTVKYAQEAFSQLPAQVRARFKNDPHELLEFIQNPENYEEGVQLGLLNKRESSTQNINDEIQKNDKQTQSTNAIKSNP